MPTASPEERLVSFASDNSQSLAKRHEADGVIRIYRQRLADLDGMADLSAGEANPLGMLLIVPGGHRGT